MTRRRPAREAMGKVRLGGIADRGYYSGPELKACEDAGIAAYVPKPTTSNAKAEGRFSKNDFVYVARDDEYQCPAGQRTIHRYTTDDEDLQIRIYWSSACPGWTNESSYQFAADSMARQTEAMKEVARDVVGKEIRPSLQEFSPRLHAAKRSYPRRASNEIVNQSSASPELTLDFALLPQRVHSLWRDRFP